MKIAAVILAAGSSTRMSSPKQLLRFHGQSLIANIADKLSNSEVIETMCVTGYLKEEIETELKNHEVRFLHNENHPEGMTSSLKMATLNAQNRKIDGLLVTLSDQPLVPRSYYHSLISLAKETTHHIMCSSYNNTFGVPTLFKSQVFDDILSLKNSDSAKSVIKKYLDQTRFIACPEATYDIDTDKDYYELLAGKLT